MGLLLSSPRIVTHWSIPPIGTKPASSTRFPSPLERAVQAVGCASACTQRANCTVAIATPRTLANRVFMRAFPFPFVVLRRAQRGREWQAGGADRGEQRTHEPDAARPREARDEGRRRDRERRDYRSVAAADADRVAREQQPCDRAARSGADQRQRQRFDDD